MAITDLRQTVLQTVNRVQRKMGLGVTATLTETRHATMLVDLLNEAISELSDMGDWNELLMEVEVSAQSSAATHSIDTTSAVIHHVHEISFANDSSPLDPASIDDMRQYQRLGSFGRPRFWTLMGVDGNGNPNFRTYPIVGPQQAGLQFNVLCYEKPNLLTTSDAATVIKFPADVVFQRLYAKALLEENSGEPSPQWQRAQVEADKMAKEALNRQTGDSGSETWFMPGR